MEICLATTWHPRGELARFERLLPKLAEKYRTMVIIIIPSDDQDAMHQLRSGKFTSIPGLLIYENEDRRRGRYTALKNAAETNADFIHYVDMDRLLHWVETQPEEWMEMVDEIPEYDCIIFGRTQKALMTHPQAIRTTEQISNQVVSYLLKKPIDISGGAKSFSLSAVNYLVEHCSPNISIGADAEWPILIKQAGFILEYKPVNGLDWESADQYQLKAVTGELQSRAAREYDADPGNWLRRTEIAHEIIQTALEASQDKFKAPVMITPKPLEFDYQAVFDVDDYLYFYGEVLTDERSDAEVAALVRLLKLEEPKTILDLACGFGRHSNRLAVLGHRLTGVDITEGFLAIAREDAQKRGVSVNYQHGDMRRIAFCNEFDYVLLLFTAFGYFSDEENLQVLINARNALFPGGIVVFDILNRDVYLKSMQPFVVIEKEDNLMIDRITFDPQRGKSYNKRIVFRDGIRKDKPYFIRLYNPQEIRDLVARAGMVVENLYGGWDAQDVSSETRKLVVFAKKPEKFTAGCSFILKLWRKECLN